MITKDDIDIQEKDILRINKLTDTLALQRDIDIDRHWQFVSRKIRHTRYSRRIFNLIRNVAAIMFIPALTASLLYIRHAEKRINDFPAEQITVVSPHGQICKIALSDGSEVWLNSGSSLTYPRLFTEGRRAVKLVGEAYFTVKANSHHRFDVETGDGLTVSAYGTEFNVHAYIEEASSQITLAQGNIEVSNPAFDNPVTLKPGQQLTCSAPAEYTVTDANLYVTTAWREGKLVFRRTAMADVVRQLSRRFNVDIQLENNELYEYEYSATFTTETISEILSLLEQSAPINCVIIEPEQDSELAFSKRKILIQTRK